MLVATREMKVSLDVMRFIISQRKAQETLCGSHSLYTGRKRELNDRISMRESTLLAVTFW